MKLMERIRFEFDCVALRAGVRMSQEVLVLSEKNRREVERLYGIRNVEVLCPGGYARKDLDPAIRRKSPTPARGVGRPILLSVCRLIRKKRVDVLIRAFRIFLDREPQSTATLFIGGTGVDEGPLRNLAQTLGLGNRVRFLGFVSDCELCDWYSACDLFLSADNADYDLTVMRALPEAKKIVVSTQYQIPNGLASLHRLFFAASANPDSFAEAIAQALGAPVSCLDATDLNELQSMTWETYFNVLLSWASRH
jgi:glycosyltransferase involved in cell wall biosynthesis